MRKGPYATHRLQYKSALTDLAKTPIICAVGDCEFLVNRVKGELEQRLASKGGYLVEAYGDVASGAAKAYKSNWQDWFVERGLFQSQIAYSLNVKGDAKLKAALAAIQSVPPSEEGGGNKLLLFCRQKSLPAGVTKELKRLKAVQIACKEPYDSEARAVITDMAKAEGLNLDGSATQALARHLGANPALIANELAKLALIFAGDSGPGVDTTGRALRADDVAVHIGAIKEDQAFTLESLLLAGNTAKAQLLMAQLLAKGDAPLMVLAIVTGFFRKLHSIHLSPAHERGEVLTSLRVPGFIHRDYFAAVRRYSEPLCGRALARCQAADQLFKSSPADPQLVLAGILAAVAPS